MRDYYPLVARAVSRLEQDTPNARQALFAQLRRVLIDQLRIGQPSASTTDIMRERAALEVAIQKIQPALLAPSKRQTAPPHAPKAVQSGSNATSRSVEPRVAANASNCSIKRSDGNLASEPAGIAGNFGRRQGLVAGEQPARRLGTALARMRAIFPDLQRDQIQPRASSDKALGLAAIEPAGRKVKPGIGGDAMPRAEPTRLPPPKFLDDAGTQQTATGSEPSRGVRIGQSTGFAGGANTTILDNLTGIQLLDRLMLDANNPLAPDNLKQDAETVLKWLGIAKAKAIKIEHYDQFGRAIRTHMMKATSSSRSAAGAMQAFDPMLPLEISRVFDRLLDEQQSAIVFDDALTWFADIWIKLIIALNFIAVVGLLASGSTLWVAIIHLLKTYSPFNTWTWIAEVVALSPALGAFAWRERRLSGSWPAALLTTKLSLLDLLLRQTRKRIAAGKTTTFQRAARGGETTPAHIAS
jgi:hypothetical protein